MDIPIELMKTQMYLGNLQPQTR